jgi:hypothetical protein
VAQATNQEKLARTCSATDGVLHALAQITRTVFAARQRCGAGKCKGQVELMDRIRDDF